MKISATFHPRTSRGAPPSSVYRGRSVYTSLFITDFFLSDIHILNVYFFKRFFGIFLVFVTYFIYKSIKMYELSRCQTRPCARAAWMRFVKIFPPSHIVFVCTRPKAGNKQRVAVRYTVSVGILQNKSHRDPMR